MTIDETKDELYRLLSDCVNNSYPIRNNTQKGRYRNAVKMAIASLEAWGKIKAEIDGQYDRVHPYNTSCAEGLEMALDIIDKHLAELEGNG